jgi:hypothetical protein
MTITMDKRWYRNTDISEFVKIYATRLARLYYLQHACSDDHPVLVAEQQLIEIARSKLQEVLLASFSVDEILKMRPYIVWWIKSTAKIRACSHIDNEKAQSAVTSSIESEELNDLFEFHGHRIN